MPFDPRRHESGAVALPRPQVHVRAASATHVGRVRPANEDACVVADLDRGDAAEGTALRRLDVGPRGVLLALSDGMGGARDGALASAITIETLVKAFASDPGLDIGDAARIAHQAVWDASCRAGHEGHTRMGATLTAALVRGDRVTIAQVGDSRAYLLRGGTITRLTHDQTMIQSLVDKGLMREEDSSESPFRNILLQAIGHQPDVDVAVTEIELRDRDCLLLCSDGLTNEVSEPEIRDIVVSSMRLDVAVTRLVDRANQHGGRDNITVVAGGIGGELPR